MKNNNIISFQNPAGFGIDMDTLLNFERGINTREPDESKIPCQVLGYGEISTVFEIHVDSMSGLAFKRMSIFKTVEELEGYLGIYHEYNRLLEEDIGIQLPTHGHAAFVNSAGRPIFYIIQIKVPLYSIGSKAIHLLPHAETIKLFQRVLRELLKVWQFNQKESERQVGIDGQISNWVIDDLDPEKPSLSTDARLLYVDTSTPLFRLKGVEQLDPEMFLRAAPSFLVWILRMLFVEDVVNRYYDFRRVIIDLLANCCKEQKPDLIPELLVLANQFFTSEAATLNIQPIEEQEVFSYYREDALIWRLYLSMRRVDRFLQNYILFREYPYILPGRIKR